MQQRFSYFRRNTGIYYLQDRVKGHQESLHTKDEDQTPSSASHSQ